MAEANKKSCLKRNAFLLLTLVGVFGGVAIGFGLRETNMDKNDILIFAFPGELLMNMFKMIVVPLVVISLIVGMGNIDPRQMGKLGGWSLTYFAATTFVAASVGVLLVTVIRPGDPSSRVGSIDGSSFAEKGKDASLVDTMLDVLRNAFTDNLFASTMRTAKTKYTYKNVTTLSNVTNEYKNETILQNVTTVVKSKSIIKVEGMNILGLVVFSIIFGALLARIGPEGKPLLDLLNASDKVINKLVVLIIWYSPFGILFLIAEKILLMDDLSAVAKMLGWYMVASLSGQLFVFVFLLLIYFAFTRKNPIRVVGDFLPALSIAAGTGSSTAALPVSLKCTEERMGLSHAICQLIMPVGCTVNMNGSAMHIAIASLFIAQLNGATITIGQMAIVALLSTLASVASAGVPSASLFTMILVLSAIEQPIKDISVIISVDFIIDRIRTMNNIFGDAIGAGILDHHFGSGMKNEESEKSAESRSEKKNSASTVEEERSTKENKTSTRWTGSSESH